MEANLHQYAQYIPRISAVESLILFYPKPQRIQDLLQILKNHPSTVVEEIIVELLNLKILPKGGHSNWTKKYWESYFYSFVPSCHKSYSLSPILSNITSLPQNLVVALVYLYEEEYWSKLPIPTEKNTKESKHMGLKEKINSDLLTYSEKRALLAKLGTFGGDRPILFCLDGGTLYSTNYFTIDKDQLSQKIKIPKIGTRTLKTILDAFECEYTVEENQEDPILIVDDSSTIGDLPQPRKAQKVETNTSLPSAKIALLPSLERIQADYEDRMRFASRKYRDRKNNPEWHKMLQGCTARIKIRVGVSDSEYHAVTSINNWRVELDESSQTNSKLTYIGPPIDKLGELVRLFSQLNLFYIDAIRSRKISIPRKIVSSYTYNPEILSKITRDLADIPLNFPVVNHRPQPYKFVSKNSSPLDELVKSVKEIKTHV